MNLPESEKPNGLPYALGAHLIWGLFPLYLLFLRDVPAFEFVGWRIVLTVPICLAIILITRQGKALRLAMGNPKVLGALTVSALLIGTNWLIFVIAIQANHVFAASLGYYINPLVNVLAGTLFLGERLSRLQWFAVALATGGVSLLASGAIEMLGISLALAFSFATYGLVRRLAPIGSLLGLTIETLMLAIPALGVIGWFAGQPGGVSFGDNPQTDMLLPLAGAVTAAPLLLFTTAARRMEYSTLGFVQYLAPTIAFFLGLFVFHEPLYPIQLACFVAIWTAMAIFSWDLWSRRAR